jgi:hypothetical protein
MEGLMEVPDLRPHGQPQLGVEVGERLVHEHERRLVDDRPGDRDPLLLTTRKLRWQLPGVILETDEMHDLVHHALELGLRDLPHLEAERDVVANGHVGEEGVVLENHAEPALLRRQAVDALAVEPDATCSEWQESGQAVESGRLAAPRRSEEGDELAPPDRQAEIAQGCRCAEVASDTVESQLREPLILHAHNPSLTTFRNFRVV